MSFRKRLLLASNNNGEIGYENQYFTIEALGSGYINWGNSNLDSYSNPIYYSKNGGGWVGSTEGSSVTVVSGDKVRFKTVRTTGKPQINFGGTAKFNVYGNIMSLIHGDDFVGNNVLFSSAFERLFQDSSVVDASNLILPATTLSSYCYYAMFAGCTSLTTAPELPATTLGIYCYGYMFQGCTSLTTAPELPVTTLTTECYVGMFSGCTSLTTAPELPATTLGIYCYEYMFNGCKSLTSAPELPATTLVYECYSNMFKNCTALTTAPELPATTLANNCYRNMFSGCTSLTTAPELPVTTLDSMCYYCMFNGCKSLTSAPELPATTLANRCYEYMFNGCKSLTSAPELPATTLAGECYASMFKNCTALTTAPELPATTLVYECYSNMFYGCSKLNYIKMLATDISASDCLYDWVYGVASTGTFIKDFSMTTLPTGESGIPVGWVIKNSNGSSIMDISWAVQTGNWTESSNSSAKDGKQFTSVSPGSSGSTRLRCTFSGVTSITFNCVYNGESNYDYLTVGSLDSTCTRDSYGTTLKGTSGTAKDITFTCDSGTHYVEFCYSKDGSVDIQPDCAVVYIKNCS